MPEVRSGNPVGLYHPADAAKTSDTYGKIYEHMGNIWENMRKFIVNGKKEGRIIGLNGVVSRKQCD